MPRAYPERVARANDEVAALFQIGGHHADVSHLDAKGLQEIPGVGRSIAEKVIEYLGGGGVAAVGELRARIPAGVRRLTAVPSLGPGKALMLYEELGLSSVDAPAEAIHAERLSDLKGFGPRTEDKLLHGIDLLRASGSRVLIVDSDAHAVPHLANLRHGVATAQRGWLTKDDVINTWPLTRLRRFLRKHRT